MSHTSQDDYLVEQLMDRLNEVKLRDVAIRSGHIRSIQTRPPSMYDRHLPLALRISSLQVSADMLDHFSSTLVRSFRSRQHLLGCLQANPGIADFALNQISKGMSGQVDSEKSVDHGLYSVFNGILGVVTLATCDIKFSTEAQSLYQYLAVASSTESETQADLIVRFHTPSIGGKSNDLSSTFPLPHEWSRLGPFYGMEVKNVLAGDPRIYLYLLLLSATFLYHKEAIFPWCHTDCSGCSAFARSHSYLDARQEDLDIPLDDTSYAPDYLDEEGLKVAVAAAISRIRIWDEVVGSHRHHRHKCESCQQHYDSDEEEDYVPAPYTGPEADKEELQNIRSVIEGLFGRYDINDPTLQLDITSWLQHAVWISVQAWSEMCRHNTTYHLVSSFQVSWIIHRNRSKGTATISKFFFPGDRIVPILAGSVVEAFEDVQKRVRLTESPLPYVDPFARQRSDKKRKRDAEKDDDADEHKRHKSKPSAGGSGGSGGASSEQQPSGAITGVHIAFWSKEYQSTGFSNLQSWESFFASDGDGLVASESSGSNISKSSLGTSQSTTSASAGSSLLKSYAVSSISSLSSGTAEKEKYSSSTVTTQQDTGSPTQRTTLPARDESHSVPGTMSAQAGVVDSETMRAGLIIDAKISSGTSCITWAGSMLLETNGPPFQVVAKIGIDKDGRDRLLREYHIYQYLRTAIASTTSNLASPSPRCHGLFVDMLGTTVLILDHAGRALDDFTEDRFDRFAVYQAAVTLHKAKVFHNDLEPRNVVVDDRGAHIIDLEAALIGHKCSGLSCSELQDLQDDLGLKNEEVSCYFE